MDEVTEPPSEAVNPPSQETDYAQGYEISVCVYPDGFTVNGPSPLPQTPSEDEERIPDLATALKHILLITKEHPLDSDLAAHFESGYADE